MIKNKETNESQVTENATITIWWAFFSLPINVDIVYNFHNFGIILFMFFITLEILHPCYGRKRAIWNLLSSYLRKETLTCLCSCSGTHFMKIGFQGEVSPSCGLSEYGH